MDGPRPPTLFEATTIPHSDAAWRAVTRAEEGHGFVEPVAGVDAVDLTDEERMNTTWTNIEFAQVRAAVEEQLRAREANAQLLDADEVCDKSSAHWELFYERNASKFFRDRHYLQRDYPEIFAALPDDARILECGCGAGNTVWPLLECFPKWTALAFDCSPTAVQLVAERRHPRVEHCFVWDPCAQPVPRDVLADGSVDLAIMMFFLSALPSEDGIRSILRSCAAMLKPNGLLLVRDYGVFDMTQLRFAGKKGRKVADNVYCRADGTLSRFFDAQWLGETAAACGLRPVKVGYECRELRNRKRMIMMYRCWVSCVFARPDEPSHHE